LRPVAGVDERVLPGDRRRTVAPDGRRGACARVRGGPLRYQSL